MNFEEDLENPLVNTIANKSFQMCFKRVFNKKAGFKATEKEDLEMELCLYNYLMTYQQVLNSTVDYIKILEKQPGSANQTKNI